MEAWLERLQLSRDTGLPGHATGELAMAQSATDLNTARSPATVSEDFAEFERRTAMALARAAAVVYGDRDERDNESISSASQVGKKSESAHVQLPSRVRSTEDQHGRSDALAPAEQEVTRLRHLLAQRDAELATVREKNAVLEQQLSHRTLITNGPCAHLASSGVGVEAGALVRSRDPSSSASSPPSPLLTFRASASPVNEPASEQSPVGNGSCSNADESGDAEEFISSASLQCELRAQLFAAAALRDAEVYELHRALAGAERRNELLQAKLASYTDC